MFNGKAKGHLLRFCGILCVLHNLIEAFSVLENIEQLNREEFINLVKSFDVKTSMSIDVVNAAVVVNNYHT